MPKGDRGRVGEVDIRLVKKGVLDTRGAYEEGIGGKTQHETVIIVSIRVAKRDN